MVATYTDPDAMTDDTSGVDPGRRRQRRGLVHARTRDVPLATAIGPDFQGRVPTRATADVDYEASDGTLTFAPSETEQTVKIRIIDDAIEDPYEIFELVLSEPSGALIADGTGHGLIFNHDPLRARFENVPRAHGGEDFTVGLTLTSR